MVFLRLRQFENSVSMMLIDCYGIYKSTYMLLVFLNMHAWFIITISHICLERLYVYRKQLGMKLLFHKILQAVILPGILIGYLSYTASQ